MPSTANPHAPVLFDRRPAIDTISGAKPMVTKTVPMDIFKWIVSSLLGVLVICVGWFLNGVQSDLRDVTKQVAGIRVEAAVTITKLDDLIDEVRRRPLR
jgi:hypothetical protein